MQPFSKQLWKAAVWEQRMQPIVNLFSGLCKGFIMNDSHQQFYKGTVVTCSNMWNKKMVSMLYRFLQACCESSFHFIFVLDIVHRSPYSHDKVFYMNFLILSTSLTKLQYMVEPNILILGLILGLWLVFLNFIFVVFQLYFYFWFCFLF